MKSLMFAMLTLIVVAPLSAQAPSSDSWRDMVRRLRQASVAHPARAARVAASPAAVIAEREPNDSIRTADSAALGDRATGVLNPANDVDTWFIDLTEGQLFSVDVDAQVLGSPLDAELVLWGPTGAPCSRSATMTERPWIAGFRFACRSARATSCS